MEAKNRELNQTVKITILIVTQIVLLLLTVLLMLKGNQITEFYNNHD